MKFEHEMNESANDIRITMSERSKDGWELVTAVPVPDGYGVFFLFWKRHIEE